jgi:hypothetical protein
MAQLREPLYVNPLETGQWIRWTTLYTVKEGLILRSEGCSIEVEWLGGERQVFPNVEGFFKPYRGVTDRMTVIERPKNATRMKREQHRGVISVQRAAAILGIPPKRVRARLRSGSLKGVKKDGKWVSVDL